MSTLPVIVDSRIRIPLALLSQKAREELQAEFTHDNPDYEREERLAKARGRRRKGPPVQSKILTWSEEDGTLTLPRGRFVRICEILVGNGYEVFARDRRTEGTGPKPKGYTLAAHIVPATFQVEARDKSLHIQNCIVRAPTGAGKTTIAEMLVEKTNLCTLVLVPDRKLFAQWVKRLQSELGMSLDDIGMIQGGKKHKIGPVTVGMVQTVSKHVQKYKSVFGKVIFDEVQGAAADTFYPAVDGLAAKYRVGFSADERRKDRKDFLIYDLFGSVAADVDRKRLIEDRFIFDTEIRLIETDFEAPWYVKLTNTQKQENWAFRKLLDQMTTDDRRNEFITDLAVKQMKAGHVLLTFSHRVDHCLDIRSRIVTSDSRVGVVVGEDRYVQESNDTLTKIVEGKIVAAVGTVQSIGKGIDLPAVDRGIVTTPLHSNKQQAGQVRGRICRVDRSPNAKKVDSVLYVLWDRKVHGLVPLRKWLQINKGNVTIYDPNTGRTEPGKAFLKRAEREEQEI
jgi:superfamily II DNA or RNA helicase